MRSAMVGISALAAGSGLAVNFALPAGLILAAVTVDAFAGRLPGEAFALLLVVAMAASS